MHVHQHVHPHIPVGEENHPSDLKHIKLVLLLTFQSKHSPSSLKILAQLNCWHFQTARKHFDLSVSKHTWPGFLGMKIPDFEINAIHYSDPN